MKTREEIEAGYAAPVVDQDAGASADWELRCHTLQTLHEIACQLADANQLAIGVKPGSDRPEVSNPIATPPLKPSHPIAGGGSPSHPIATPPPQPSHPIAGGGETPTHPIAGGDEDDEKPSHPIAGGGPGRPSHPIATPPAKPSHPIAPTPEPKKK